MHRVDQILKSYQILPHSVEKMTSQLFRVYDGSRYYALKRSHITKSEIRNWESVFHQAHAFHFPDILPVYLTTEHHLYTEEFEEIYYLSPWIEHKEYSMDQFFNSIGHIHAKTKRSYPMRPEEPKKQQFEQYKKVCEVYEKKWLENIDLFEQKRYMSPFELQACTHYRDLTRVFRFIYERIDAFIESINEESKWSYSLCHGNLKRSHFLFDGQGYFINWENARFDNAIVDLTHFFRNETREFDAQTEDMIDHFSIYMDENKLEMSELYLLIIYLLDPSLYMSLIQQYVKQPKYDSMINQVRGLEHAFRQLQFGILFSEHVKNEYGLLFSDDDLESSH